MKLYARLLGYLRPYVWPRGVAMVACMLCFSGIESSVPFIVRYAIEQVLVAGQTQLVPVLAAGVVGLSLVRGLLEFAGNYLSDWIGQRVVTDLRKQLAARVQTLDVAYVNKTRAGQIVSRVTADSMLVRQALTDAVKSIFKDSTTLIGLVIVAVYMDWVLAVLGLVVLPAAAVPIRLLSTRLRQQTRRQQQEVGRLNAMLHENVQGNRVVKVFGKERYEAQRIGKQAELVFRIFMRTSRLRSFPVAEIVAGLAMAGVFWYGAGTRTAGNLGAFLVALALLYEPFKKLVKTNYAIQQGLAGADRIFALLDMIPDVRDRPDARPFPGVGEGIRFERVEFAYDAGVPVLHGIDLEIPAGSVVALVGESGGGKSTIADLIPRLYDVTGGRITIGGVDIRDVRLAELRAHIAVVTQFTFLFNDTVRANIAYGEPERPLEEVIAAARAANAHEFIERLPNGYDTQIGDLGVRLSGGQRQRLAIARAILRNAPILILDEATSALDTESESLVQDALERLMVNRTTVVVAHRLSTIRRADAIVVVAGGRIVERGRHEELLARGGEYRQLYDRQFGAEEVSAERAQGT
ncbi:MAG TPA: ABC transporter ATP-binding protein [Candidatus Limnocylindria bacterium]|nr:ABC transporter ATP-binding protein [Candidatus Limnocylindria bacterium]